MKKILANLAQAHSLFIVIAIIFGVIFVVITPPLWGADEGQHFIRAYQISQGDFAQKRSTIDGRVSEGGSIPVSLSRLDRLREQDIADAVPGEIKQVDSRDAYSRASNTPIEKDRIVANPYGKIIYSPIVYAAPSLGIVAGNVFSQTALPLLIYARTATLLLYVGLVCVALYMLRKSVLKWMVFVIALLPMSIYQASVVSPDSLLLGASLVFFARLYTVLYMGKQLSGKDAVIILASAGLLTFIKVPYVFLPLLLLVLPLPVHLPKRTKQFLKFGVPLFCLAVALVSLAMARGAITTPLPGIDVTGQLQWVLSHPLSYLYVVANSVLILNWVPQIIGLFGSSFVLVPGVVSQVLLIVLVLLAFVDNEDEDKKAHKGDNRASVVYLGISLITALAIISTLYLTWTPVGASLAEGIQGRYFLPLVVFFLVGLRLGTKGRLITKNSVLRASCTTITVSALLISVLWYYRILY